MTNQTAVSKIISMFVCNYALSIEFQVIELRFDVHSKMLVMCFDDIEFLSLYGIVHYLQVGTYTSDSLMGVETVEQRLINIQGLLNTILRSWSYVSSNMYKTYNVQDHKTQCFVAFILDTNFYTLFFIHKPVIGAI